MRRIATILVGLAALVAVPAVAKPHSFIIIGKGSHIVRRVLTIDDPVLDALDGEALVQLPDGQDLSPDGLAAFIAKTFGAPPPSDRVAVIDQFGQVANVIKADPLVDAPPHGAVMLKQSDTAVVGQVLDNKTGEIRNPSTADLNAISLARTKAGVGGSPFLIPVDPNP